MASVQCFKNTEKGLNQGYYGGGSMSQNAEWGYKANKYQGPQNGYPMAYCETESQTAYGMAESWDEHGRSYGAQKFQNGNAMSKNQVHGRGNGFGNPSSNGVYGSSNHSNPGKHQGHGYGYGGSCPRNQKNSCGMGTGMGMGMGMGQGFNTYEMTHDGYGYEESNGYGKYTNNNGLMAHRQGHLGRKHSGHRKGPSFMRNQAYGGPGKNMGYEISETETCEYNETYYSNESHYHGGGAGGYHAGKGGDMMREMKRGISGNNSCSDSENDSDDDDDYGMRKVWISKAI
ncbi:hypothetical protein DITRI_Ditri20bG0028300 [Diplodiscus trichospermus]